MEGADQDVVMGGDDRPSNHTTTTNGIAEPASGEPKKDSSSSADEDDEEDYEDYDADAEAQAVANQLRRRGLLPTACCYDDRMKLHVNADFGTTPHHPEDPRRIEEIFKAFKKAGLVYTGPESKVGDVLRDHPTKYMWRIGAREATKEEILTTHTPLHYHWVESLSRMDYATLRETSRQYDQGRASLYVGSLTFMAALLSCGGAIDTCKHVVEGNVKNAFAVIRPPGHHAEYDQPLGFCFFNNVPVAVKICQQEYPDDCRKVLILDWDVHHGNGIQNIFYDDPNVLYISLHVYQNGIFYPGKPDNQEIPDGGLEHCGTGPGLGRNVNIGWHDQGMGDGEYMAAFQKIIMPIAKEFNPDLVVISAGFDAAAGDELGGCFVTPACYAHMTHMLMSLADGKVAVCLEGGYNLHAISTSAVAVARTLMGEPPPKMDMPMLNKEAARVLAKVQSYQAPYWECMRPGIVLVPEIQDLNVARLNDHIRLGQRQDLSQRHQMIPLFIQRDLLFKAYENQVLVTPDISTARRILVVMHDPPELLAQPDVIDRHVETHNAWIVDSVAPYIDWAVKEGIAVMDVNVPNKVSRDEDTDPYSPRTAEKDLISELQELVNYLWDNYLQLYEEADDILLMGVGRSCNGVRALLTGRDSKARIAGVVNFIEGMLRPVKSDVDNELATWYKAHSQVYVSHDHPCWNSEDTLRRVTKRRFGTVIRSETNGVNRMMQTHAADVQKWMMERLAARQGGDTTEDDKMS
ncbi:Histone deacetylase clr3 [Colletotrichum chlorophyti]|uniref:Histone deacetylase n=1 Tax=Colletotrichum chlorophyti TaxID=708187 RepID=A0A1Q8S1R8_9PEZI|nr:Histone deacetylase clr3 [Colletotrichum chlorophyti]